MKCLVDVLNNVFDQFIDKFIYGNKCCYKVNMDNIVDVIINKLCEQYFLFSCLILFVYIDVNEGRVLFCFVMVNEFN